MKAALNFAACGAKQFGFNEAEQGNTIRKLMLSLLSAMSDKGLLIATYELAVSAGWQVTQWQ